MEGQHHATGATGDEMEEQPLHLSSLPPMVLALLSLSFHQVAEAHSCGSFLPPPACPNLSPGLAPRRITIINYLPAGYTLTPRGQPKSNQSSMDRNKTNHPLIFGTLE